MEYPKERNLDGMYFRVQRDERWCNICFTDLTENERESVMENRSVDWIKSLANRLADVVHEIGDELGIERD